jgi:hypothetical protein
MTTQREKDLVVGLLTVLALLVFAATWQGWNVPLIGDSHRWAAVGVLLLGVAGCGLGTAGAKEMHRTLAALGIVALVLAVAAIVSGSLVLVGLLVADMLVLWLGSAAAHLGHDAPRATPRPS